MIFGMCCEPVILLYHPVMIIVLIMIFGMYCRPERSLQGPPTGGSVKSQGPGP